MAGKIGADGEREVADLFRAEGYVVARSAGSRGSADLVAMRVGDRPLLLQVKGGSGNLFRGFGPDERKRLKADALKGGAVPLLCRWIQATNSWRLVSAEHWPQDEPTRHRADYMVDPDTGCWLWQKALRPDGYGGARRGGRYWLMHRYFYERHVGPIPEGLHLDHLCRTRACVNPDHLEPVTQQENNLRGNLTKLSPAQVRAIRASEGPVAVVASEYGITRGYVWRLRKGLARKDVE